MKVLRFLILSLFLLCSLHYNSQTNWDKKGSFYFSWGYNRSIYGLSDISFNGPGYNFELKKLKAVDKPTGFDPNVYFSITKLTIPQFNFRLGYFINEHLALSIGYDHMKYVMIIDQTAKMYGYIDSSASTKYEGIYTGENLVVHDDLVTLEHTDGLNYATLDIEYHDKLYGSRNQDVIVDFFCSAGIGAVIPKTNAYILNTRGADTYHLAGLGISGSIGIRSYFFKYFYLQAATKPGFLYMPNIATNGFEVDRASQNITFLEFFGQFGARFNLFK